MSVLKINLNSLGLLAALSIVVSSVLSSPISSTSVFYPGSSWNTFNPLRNRRSNEEVQLLPEIGLAARRIPFQGYSKTDLTSSSSQVNKRSTMLLDKIMFALQKAINNADDKSLSTLSNSPKLTPNSRLNNEESIENGEEASSKSTSKLSNYPKYTRPIARNPVMNFASYSGSGLERRGNAHGKVYWRCYFNAVSCF